MSKIQREDTMFTQDARLEGRVANLELYRRLAGSGGGGGGSAGTPVYFRGARNTDLALSAAAWIGPIAFVETDDSDNFYNGTKFQPTRAGWYRVAATVVMNGLGTANPEVAICKNGTLATAGSTAVAVDVVATRADAWASGNPSALVYFNGTSDYAEVYVYSATTGTIKGTSNEKTYFEGEGIGSAGPVGATGPAGPAGVVNRGAWSAATAYAVNDAVTYQGSMYWRKVAGTTASNPSADPVNWDLVVSKGDPGAAGAQGIQGTPRWKGEWDTLTVYAKDDFVSENGVGYVARRTTTAGDAPSTHSAGPAYDWALAIDRGAPGVIEVYEQPGTPSGADVGAVWIDTDESPPSISVVTTTETIVMSLPSSPVDGQIINYLADAANGIVWRLRYRSAASGSYKWEFVGGSPLRATAAFSFVVGTINTWVDISPTPSITAPLAGDYDIDFGAYITQSTLNQNGRFGVINQATPIAPQDIATAEYYGPIISMTQHRSFRFTGVVAAQPLKLVYYATKTDFSYGLRYLQARPVRVG